MRKGSRKDEALRVHNSRWLLTLDDLANANASDKVAAADRAVEPVEMRGCVSFESRGTSGCAASSGLYILRALVVGLGGVLEEASVLDGDGLAGLGLRASALLMSSLGDAHFAYLRDSSG